jgi:hypothetical protein
LPLTESLWSDAGTLSSSSSEPDTLDTSKSSNRESASTFSKSSSLIIVLPATLSLT